MTEYRIKAVGETSFCFSVTVLNKELQKKIDVFKMFRSENAFTSV